jgi:hypothetical protein
MIPIAYFYLLRPGEYTGTASESTPFRVQDVTLFSGGRSLDLATCTEHDIFSATFAVLEFSTQRNGVRGECIGLGLSGDAWLQLCPVNAWSTTDCTRELLLMLLQNRWHQVSTSHISQTLKDAVTYLGPVLGFLVADVSARSLRAAGAMALLCAQVDTDVIRIIGCWRSDEMLRYLHVQTEPVMRDFAAKMLSGGSFVRHPSSVVPSF